MNIPFFKTTANITDKFLIKNYPDYYYILFNSIKEINIPISERIYLYQNNLTEKPCCLNCNNKVKFKKFYIGYAKYCSKKCAATHTHQNTDIKEKRIKALSDSNSNIDIRNEMTRNMKISKSLFTDTQKFNIQEKRRNTTLVKYGVDNISKQTGIKDIIKSKSKITLKSTQTAKSIKSIEKSKYEFISMDNEEFEIKCPICQKIFKIKKYLFNRRKKLDNTICILCNKIGGKSDFENKVYNFIQENYNDTIINGYNKYKKYQIDIYLPELRLGFECNGLYWHSELYRDKNYHINKFNFFKENDISIYNIWEDDWIYKKEIIKDNILKIISVFNHTITATDCIITEINTKTAKIFLNTNHILGYAKSDINVGLLSNNNLVCILSIKNNQILRYAELLSYNAIGGFNYLLNYYTNKFKISNIEATLDISFMDNTFIRNGFKIINNIKPTQYYFNKDKRIRNKNKQNGDYRIWDCGKYQLNKDFLIYTV